jgi:hypothetical protein
LIIKADLQRTWPAELLEALSLGSAQIKAYQAERARIDRAAQKDVGLRICRPDNTYQEMWDSILGVANAALKDQRLLGFHASRLTIQEVEDIRKGGMKVLSADLLGRRLDRIAADGLTSRRIIEILHSNNQAGSASREGRTYFCFGQKSVRCESGVRRLFQSWGGEALYWGHEDDVVIGPALRTIGKPCIVIAAIPVEDIRTYMSLGELLVNVWCTRNRIRTGHEAGFEGHTRADVATGNIVRIIEFIDPEFEKLTRYPRWRKPLT